MVTGAYNSVADKVYFACGSHCWGVSCLNCKDRTAVVYHFIQSWDILCGIEEQHAIRNRLTYCALVPLKK
jgi:hypothetical protein